MGLFSKKNNKPVEAIVFHLQGLPNTGKNSQCRVSEDEEFVKIEELEGFVNLKVKNTFKIASDRIIAIESLTKENIKEKSKSVVGRGVTGGLLFGPAGMLLGGLSGTGTKKEVKKQYLLNISYYGQSKNDIKNLIFNAPGVSALKMMKFVDNYNETHFENVTTNENGEIIL
ncbi:hypothetical protein VT91_09230 [Clostridium sporogenes]|uniref:hypothetical protein n=1 Tax=Clostridium botulinum TaxID=1491 RepID=UPI0007176148|nr:hypothetical protein [Clostridium botulinum]KRU29309.1 hypothetical protein WG71_15520 [Clostridium sporogenes]KRU33397.1 hypothetical protein VT91_09230 [Clostridium sporogenes]KRU33971.1 hypothetical protein VT28_05270 [Clostridium sporogenes]KRU43381.1 hypothetical protein VT95_16460 [Clostridium sporogenes]MBZ1330968.1 hypothetical protein [Clostridium botulinum]